MFKRTLTITLVLFAMIAAPAFACDYWDVECRTRSNTDVGEFNQEAYMDARAVGQKFDEDSPGVLSVGGNYGPTGNLMADHELILDEKTGLWEVASYDGDFAVNSRSYGIGSDWASAGRLCDPLVVGKLDYGSFYAEGNIFGGFGAIAGSGGYTFLEADALASAGNAGRVNLAVDGQVNQWSGNAVTLSDTGNYAAGGQNGHAEFTAYDSDGATVTTCELWHKRGRYGRWHSHGLRGDPTYNEADDFLTGQAGAIGGTLVGSWTNGNEAKSFGVTAGGSYAKTSDGPYGDSDVSVQGSGGIETQANVMRENNGVFAGATAHGAAGYSYSGSGSTFAAGGGVAGNYTNAKIDSYGNNGITSSAGGMSFAGAGATGGGNPQ